MKALIQRVTHASVTIDNIETDRIDQGLLAFIGVEPSDNEVIAEKCLQRILDYRVFGDDEDKMNLSVQAIHGGLLLIPQFTLAADTRKGLRPSFSTCAPPDQGKQLFLYACAFAEARHPQVAYGQFGAHMKISLCNDGPVTFLLEIH